MTVLEIGSGFGTAAIDLYFYANVAVVGVENNDFKVDTLFVD